MSEGAPEPQGSDDQQGFPGTNTKPVLPGVRPVSQDPDLYADEDGDY